MPDRFIRAGIRKSERTAKAIKLGGWFAGLFYAWLLTVVDDYGRWYASPTLLRSEMFPYLLDDVTEAMIADALLACANANLINLYDADGKRFLEVLDFNQRMRAWSSKFPPPPENVLTLTGQSPDDDRTMRAYTNTNTYTNNKHVPTKRTKQRGKAPDDEPAAFAAFMEAWPNHFRKPSPGSKLRAQLARLWQRENLDAQADAIMVGLAQWKRSRQWQSEGGQYIPGPMPWLNQRRWIGDAPPPAGGAIGGGGGGPNRPADPNGFVRKYDPHQVDEVLKLVNENGKAKQARSGSGNGGVAKT